MAARLTTTTVTFKPLHRSSSSNFFLRRGPNFLPSPLRFKDYDSVCYVVDVRRQISPIDEKPDSTAFTDADEAELLATSRISEKLERKKSERLTYLIAAVMSSLGITSMAIMSVYYRFSWQIEGCRNIPLSEMFATFALSVGAAVGMEFWARWAHKALWHASLWNMHESHHKPREGAFELNDVFAVVNALPAIGLLSYGFFNKGLVPGLCFGAGLGITVFGIAYMFVHDGLVHKRFPVGPIADVPYLRKVAAAHQELEEVGGDEELNKEISRRIKLYKKESSQIID